MTRYNGVVVPRAFTVTVDADTPEDAERKIREYVNTNIIVTMQDTSDTYDAENLLDDYDIEDIQEWDP